MAKILGYSQWWDKLKDGYKIPEEEVNGLIYGLLLGDIDHTSIRLDRNNGWYVSGTWQEVFKPRSKDRVIINPSVLLLTPLEVELGELVDNTTYEDLIWWDTLKDGVGMKPHEFYEYVESNFKKDPCWKEDKTPMNILPITI